MDLFTREPGNSYVPAFAGRLLLAMAQGIARATGEMKRVLLAEDAEGMWTLAMVVVQWYADALPQAESKVVMDALCELGVASIASNLNYFRERLVPFVKTAHEARSDAQLAAAGVYFVGAVDQIGQTILSSAMKSAALGELARKLKVRLPLPGELKAEYGRVRSGQPSVPTRPATPDSASRGDRFERADYSVARPVTQGARAESVESAPRARSLPRPPKPNLANAEVARAYLHTLGWDEKDVDLLLQGPEAPAAKRRA